MKRKTPAVLDAVADKVLSYRPKPKSDKAEKRRRKRARVRRRQRARESCV
jgi:hypothetical protein